MGVDQPDYTEDIYCSSCRKVTPHDIYKKSKQVNKTRTVYGELFQHDETVDIGTYTTKKQVCTECGKTKKKTTRDFCCRIF